MLASLFLSNNHPVGFESLDDSLTQSCILYLKEFFLLSINLFIHLFILIQFHGFLLYSLISLFILILSQVWQVRAHLIWSLCVFDKYHEHLVSGAQSRLSTTFTALAQGVSLSF